MTEERTGFIAGTLVHTKEGLKPIEEIQIGDLVLSHPEEKPIPVRMQAPFRLEDEYTYRKVTNTFVLNEQPISKLIVTSGEKETILVAADHAIFLNGRGWISVSQIEAGDCLENSDFANLLVYRIYHDVETAQVFNLEVDVFQTYYVGQQGVWVHNRSASA